jgi:hypothetical protein
MAMADAMKIRVIAFKDGDQWVAQCLEYDIAAQAADLETVHARLMMALDAERAESMRLHDKPFAGIDPAPQHFLDMWSRRSGVFNPRRPSDLKADGCVALDMALCA